MPLSVIDVLIFLSWFSSAIFDITCVGWWGAHICVWIVWSLYYLMAFGCLFLELKFGLAHPLGNYVQGCSVNGVESWHRPPTGSNIPHCQTSIRAWHMDKHWSRWYQKSAGCLWAAGDGVWGRVPSRKVRCMLYLALVFSDECHDVFLSVCIPIISKHSVMPIPSLSYVRYNVWGYPYMIN